MGAPRLCHQYDDDVKFLCGYMGFGYDHEVVIPWTAHAYRHRLSPALACGILQSSHFLPGTQYKRPFHSSRLLVNRLAIPDGANKVVLSSYYETVDRWGLFHNASLIDLIEEAQRIYGLDKH
jgi:hypothetical protein